MPSRLQWTSRRTPVIPGWQWCGSWHSYRILVRSDTSSHDKHYFQQISNQCDTLFENCYSLCSKTQCIGIVKSRSTRWIYAKLEHKLYESFLFIIQQWAWRYRLCTWKYHPTQEHPILGNGWPGKHYPKRGLPLTLRESFDEITISNCPNAKVPRRYFQYY